MKITDAVWEQRNLGVTSYGISLDMRDHLQDVQKEYSKLQEKEYMVVKIPSSRYDLAYYFQEQGYLFSESSIRLSCDLQKLYIPERILKICKKCTWVEMKKEDLDQLSKEIYKDIFKKDKVFTDPKFKPEQSARRYDLWIRDLVSAGTMPYKVMYGGDTIGFFLNQKIEQNAYYGVMAAVYSDYEGTGMGYCIQYAGLQSAIERGADTYIGYVSGTNPEVLKILLSIGYVIKEIDYIFIKHNEGE